MPVAIIRNEIGMTSVAMTAARKLPSSQNSTAATSNAPSSRFFSTVPIVASTSSERSSTVLTVMPGGSDFGDLFKAFCHRGSDDPAVAVGKHQARCRRRPPCHFRTPSRCAVRRRSGLWRRREPRQERRHGWRPSRGRFHRPCGCGHRRGRGTPRRRVRRSLRRPRCWPFPRASASSEKEMP